jgi:putative acetyltransferase
VAEIMPIRLADRTDQPQIVRLIADIFREYGETICLDNCDSDLLDLERNFTAQGGNFWVLEEQGKIKGTVAVTPSHEPSTDPIVPCLLKRLYLHPSLRGGSWGRDLMQTAVDWARQQGFQRMEFWSDSRFSRAHNFYQKFGCLMTGQTRVMHDSYEPYEEYHFRLELVPVPRGQVAE